MNDTNYEPVPLSAFIVGFEPDYVGGVIEDVLQYRSQASEGARDALNSAIRDSINLNHLGFKDSSNALVHVLRDEVLYELTVNARMAGAVLRAWVESQEPLRAVVADHLAGQDIPTDGPDTRRRVFSRQWSRDDWEGVRDQLAQEGRSPDEVALMMCWVSGMSPPLPDSDRQVESETFAEWLRQMEEMPPDALEWGEIDAFVKMVEDLAALKDEERAAARQEALRAAFAEVREEYEAELRYLDGYDALGSWEEQASGSPAIARPALELLQSVQAALDEYRPVRPQAESRQEEEERAVQRREREERVLELVSGWDEMAAEALRAEALREEQEAAVSDQGGETEGEEQPQDTAEETPAVSPEKHEALVAEVQRLREEKDVSEAKAAILVQENSGLRADMEALEREASEVRAELLQSQSMAESWRLGYVSAKAASNGDESEETPPPDSVNEAVARAEESFPDQLAFALNSKSAKNSPYQKPEEVFDVLAWLATEYHSRRTSPSGQAPHFDKLLKEACSGWSYKPKQTEVTRDQFIEWYTTTLGDKSYDLVAHIGKGNSYDPKNTMRIAFAWDDDLRKVVVGFIGHHQRNRSS